MTGHIFIYGYIGTAAGEVSVKNVQAQIDKAASDYVVHIISGGGDVFEGYGIYNLLKNTGKKVVTHVEGVCASISTLIAGAASEIVMNKTAQWMIHNPQISDIKGDARILRNVANQLDKIKTLLIDVYQAKTGLQKEKLWELYDNETWLTAEEAQRIGFVDDVQDAIKAVAKITLPMENNVLTKVLNWFKVKFKNQLTETLEDGRTIIVMAEGEDWAGAQVVLETGEPLPAGDHKLASGKIISVDESSTITQVAEAEVPEASTENPTETEEDMKKIEELQAKIATLESQLEEKNKATAQAETEKTQAQNISAQFENRMKTLEEKLAQAAITTVGDKSSPAKGPAFKNASDEDKYDPMGEEVMKILKSRNRI